MDVSYEPQRWCCFQAKSSVCAIKSVVHPIFTPGKGRSAELNPEIHSYPYCLTYIQFIISLFISQKNHNGSKHSGHSLGTSMKGSISRFVLFLHLSSLFSLHTPSFLWPRFPSLITLFVQAAPYSFSRIDLLWRLPSCKNMKM